MQPATSHTGIPVTPPTPAACTPESSLPKGVPPITSGAPDDHWVSLKSTVDGRVRRDQTSNLNLNINETNFDVTFSNKCSDLVDTKPGAVVI